MTFVKFHPDIGRRDKENRRRELLAKQLIAVVEKVSKSAKHVDEWLTVRALAKLFRVKQDDIIDIIESHDCLDLGVGYSSSSDSIAPFDNKGDYFAEWLGGPCGPD